MYLSVTSPFDSAGNLFCECTSTPFVKLECVSFTVFNPNYFNGLQVRTGNVNSTHAFPYKSPSLVPPKTQKHYLVARRLLLAEKLGRVQDCSGTSVPQAVSTLASADDAPRALTSLCAALSCLIASSRFTLPATPAICSSSRAMSKLRPAIPDLPSDLHH